MSSARTRTSKSGCALNEFIVRKKNKSILAIVIWIRNKMKNK